MFPRMLLIFIKGIKMGIAISGAAAFVVIMGVMLYSVHYVRVLKPEKDVQKYMKECIEQKKLEQAIMYTPKEAEEKIVSELVGNEPIRFTVENIKEYQSSSSPFTDEELQDIMDEELALGDDMNTELVDYILKILN